MTDTVTTDTAWPDKTMTPAQQDARERASALVVRGGGAIPMNFEQMVDYARFMSTARGAVGAHLMGNVGACLAVMEIGAQFGMPYYAVARQSYLVNNRVAFMGQFFHSIIELHAPLKKGPNGRKLQWRYEGTLADGTLKIFVSGTFEGAIEPVVYESPMFSEITTKNSPLWKSPAESEVKRQFVYFGVRGWQTEYWPEGMMQAMTEDEAAALPPSERAIDVTPVSEGLRERLAAAHADTPPEQREGFQPGFTEAEFTEISKDPAAIDAAIAAASDAPPAEVKKEAEPPPADPKPAGKKKDTKAKKTDKPKPTSAEAWVPYAREWLTAEQDPAVMRKRWQDEMKMRNDLGVTSEQRDPVFEYYQERLAELEGRT